MNTSYQPPAPKKFGQRWRNRYARVKRAVQLVARDPDIQDAAKSAAVLGGLYGAYRLAPALGYRAAVKWRHYNPRGGPMRRLFLQVAGSKRAYARLQRIAIPETKRLASRQLREAQRLNRVRRLKFGDEPISLGQILKGEYGGVRGGEKLQTTLEKRLKRKSQQYFITRPDRYASRRERRRFARRTRRWHRSSRVYRTYADVKTRLGALVPKLPKRPKVYPKPAPPAAYRTPTTASLKARLERQRLARMMDARTRQDAYRRIAVTPSSGWQAYRRAAAKARVANRRAAAGVKQ